MLEKKVKRIAGYIWFPEMLPLTQEMLHLFFEKCFSESEAIQIEVVDVFVDYIKPMAVHNRTGWNQLLEAKEQGRFDMICIPSMEMLPPYPFNAFYIAQELSSGPYPVEVLFMRENLLSSHPDSSDAFTFHVATENHIQHIKERKRKLRKNFREIYCPHHYRWKLRDEA